MQQFCDWFGEKRVHDIRLIVMDMWKPFRNIAQERAPQTTILSDMFHVMQHLNGALDQVSKNEDVRLKGKDRRYIKGQKYVLLKHSGNLMLPAAANHRLNIAYHLPKESFEQLRDYEREGQARRFFDNWKASLKWQRLKPYEKFAEVVERHWDGIAAHCKPENRVPLGFVEKCFNHKIRVIQRRAHGLRDEEHLRL